MAITFVGSAFGGGANGGNATADLSGLSMQENDLVLAFGGSQRGPGQDDIAFVTSDYAELFDQETAAYQGSDFLDTVCGYKFMGTSPDSSVVINGSGDSLTAAGLAVMVFRGVDTTTPIDVTTPARNTNTGSTIQPDSPAITPVTANAALIAMGATAGALGISPSDEPTPPSGYGGLVFGYGNDSLDCGIGMAWKTLATPAEDDPAAWAGFETSVSSGVVGATVALRPAAEVSAILQSARAKFKTLGLVSA